MKVSVVGLGKLGLCTATCFAYKKHDVIGFDLNKTVLTSLKNRKNPIEETGLTELLDKSWGNLSISDDIDHTIKNSDLTTIIVPTPSGEDGRFINDYIISVLTSIAPALKEKETFHVVDIVSTVMPGTCKDTFIPFLEQLTGKKCGVDFGVVYNPEFIALGSVIKVFQNPDMVLIGYSDQKSLEMTKKLYEQTVLNDPYYAEMDLTSAEITKLSLNCYVTMKISYANELSSIVENIPGTDIDKITRAIGSDSRIGNKYLKAGLGFGGPCFPRDNLAFQKFAEGFGVEAKIGKQVVAVNRNVINRVLSLIKRDLKDKSHIAILGLSYKSETHIIEESQSISVIDALLSDGYLVTVHDPQAIDTVKAVFKDRIKYSDNIDDAIKNKDSIVIMTDWSEYDVYDWKSFDVSLKRKIKIVDCWRTLSNNKFKNITYSALGQG